LNQLLTELDGFAQSGMQQKMSECQRLISRVEGVVVIAATNFPQSLDQYVANN
jgi:SpoVK/Ycf46/Vps4 family AAA+-type ATPase